MQDGRWRAEWTEGEKKTKKKNQEDEKGLYLAGADSSSLIGLDCEHRLYEHE